MQCGRSKTGVLELIDNFYRPEGRLLLAIGNGIMPGMPLENIEAAFKEWLNINR
jgi:hypothetical protein